MLSHLTNEQTEAARRTDADTRWEVLFDVRMEVVGVFTKQSPRTQWFLQSTSSVFTFMVLTVQLERQELSD